MVLALLRDNTPAANWLTAAGLSEAGQRG